MTILRCPHCGKDIELIDTKLIQEEYEIGPNVIALARQRGEFPEPALGGPPPQKFYWTRDSVEEYLEERRDKRLKKLMDDVAHTLDGLPDTERERALKMLTDDHGPKRKR